MRLADKTALITGAAKGLGAAIAHAFLNEGARVYLADIDDARGRAQADALGGDAQYIHLDISRDEDWANAMGEIDQLDVLVNCAGVTSLGSIEEVTLAKYRHEFDVDVFGVMLGCQHGISKMSAKGAGSIINFSSATAEISEPELAIYTSAKAAVVSLTKSTALHCLRSKNGIRVNCISPGIIQTEMLEGALAEVPEGEREEALKRWQSKVPLGRFGKPGEIASAALFLASEEESGFTTGINLFVDGGASI